MSAPVTVVHTIAETRRVIGEWRGGGQRVGFVPTMGALHAGHRSLVEQASARGDKVVVSIFVNPLQFGPTEDLSRYPRTLDADCSLVAEAGGSLVFAPSGLEMYPEPITTAVSVGVVSEPLEGRRRPGHFDGVATVVHKLLNIVGPCQAFFGEKDWQQLAVIRRMVVDLSIDVDIVGCPTVREADGLALSSRNVYLSDHERREAVSLSKALRHGAAMIEGGERDGDVVEAAMAAMISPAATLDYAVVVNAASLQPVKPLSGELRLLVAARFASARLIDNVGVTAPASKSGSSSTSQRPSNPGRAR
jgi:pantoate--beta-alanine ligase